jgi:hypothetical protein
MKTNILIGASLVLLGAAGAYVFILVSRPSPDGGAPETAAGVVCATHDIAAADCPWCDPSLIEKKGQCVGHDVPEALCSRCNPALIAGFKAENDWCAGHNVPESQCTLCQAGQFPPGEKQP